MDTKAHRAVREGRTTGRGKNTVIATGIIHSDWANISGVSSKNHLLCTNWCHPLHESMAKNFRPGSDTIYQAKWFSILCFDTFTAYDNASVKLFNRDFNKPPTYYEMMKRIRQDIMAYLDNTGGSLQDFRRYDNPSEFFPDIPCDSLKPIGNIIDKIYLTL